MGNRYEDLEPFLPPAPRGKDPEAAPPSTTDSRRQRLARVSFRRLPALITATTTLCAAVAAAVLLSPLPAQQTPTGNRVQDPLAGVSQGRAIATPAAPDRRATERKRRPKRDRRVIRVRRRVTVATPAEAVAVSQDTASPPPARVKAVRERRHPKRRQAREKVAPALPPPPEEPLFHCTHENENFMTIDEARMAQMESSRANWECLVVGYVYATAVSGTQALELHDGTAFVFAEKGARTDPECTVDALFKHWGGYEWWYSLRPSDGGFSGYLRI